MFSALAARAGGAEAAADWFPRWASFASDDTPYIHSRGYQTVRTSGSTGAAAAAVLEIVKEDRRKRGDATPVTVLFPNKTILEMPLDGDQVDTLPDGTSLIFDRTRSTGRTAADAEVAALLKRLGLERLETTFAREQIEAEALPLLTVDDLCGVGVPADDASRIVAAASASSASVATMARPPRTRPPPPPW